MMTMTAAATAIPTIAPIARGSWVDGAGDSVDGSVCGVARENE